MHLQNHHKASYHSQDVPLVMFDYHTECRGGNTKHLVKLRDKVKKQLNDFGFFHCNADTITM